MNPDPSPKPAPRRILLVDDEEEMSFAVGLMLKRMGHVDVDYALNARTAYRKLLDREYALVITDYQMPEINGLQLVEVIKHTGMQVPIVILTSEGADSFVDKVIQAGAEILNKPITMEELEEVVKKYL
ncbi:MAG: response regulator [Chloroflexi bacterium]|nr:response regulator [Chloroflexota bacterium]